MPIIKVTVLQWQTLWKQLGFQGGEICRRVFAEAPGCAPRLLPHLQFRTQAPPRRHTAGTQRFRSPRAQLCRDSCHHPHRPTYHDGRRRPLVSRRASFMVPRRPKILLQVIVRAGDRGLIIAVE